MGRSIPSGALGIKLRPCKNRPEMFVNYQRWNRRGRWERSSHCACGRQVFRAGGKFSAAVRGDHFDLDSTERAVAPGIRRIVSQGVLVPDVVGDLQTDVVHVRDVFREIGKAAGSLGDIFESFFGALGALLAFLAEQADRVDHSVGFLNLPNCFFERIAAGVVFSIGDDQEDALVLGRFFQMVERADHGVIQRGAAARINALERFFQLRNAAGEILVEVEIKIVVEIDDEGLVLGIAGLHERDGGLVHAGPFVAHAAAVVDDQPHADGDVFAFEDGKFLLDFVFQDTEILLLEAIGEAAAIIKHGRVQNDEVDLNFYARALLFGAGLLARRDRLWQRNGELRRRGKRRENKGAEQHHKKRNASHVYSYRLSGQGRSSRFLSRR